MSLPSITECEMHITAQPPPLVSEMTYTVSSGTLNSTTPYHTYTKLLIHKHVVKPGKRYTR